MKWKILLCVLCLHYLITMGDAKKKKKKESSLIKPLEIAFCLTGQLARLELISKIRNVLIPNAIIGHNIHLFVLLDPNVTDVKQTFWRFDYSSNPYNTLNAAQMKEFILNQITVNLLGTKFERLISTDDSISRFHIYPIRFQSPSQYQFSVRGKTIPVGDKTGPSKDPFANDQGIEPASSRFQNNLRWMAAVRDCVRWVQSVEVDRSAFFDVVIRLRDDSYVIQPWLIDPAIYQGSLVSTKIGASFGLNDHDFSVDRYWADHLFRGITEDYYFNSSMDHISWVNPEHRIYRLARSYNIPHHNTHFCEHPIVPLRGRYNKTHWRLHVTYTENVVTQCLGPDYAEDKKVVNSIAQPRDRYSKQELTKKVIDRIGVRAPNESCPYQYEKLIQTMARNRKILLALEAVERKARDNGKDVMEAVNFAADASFNDIDRLEQVFCCNDELVAAMKSQVLPIEAVYELLH